MQQNMTKKRTIEMIVIFSIFVIVAGATTTVQAQNMGEFTLMNEDSAKIYIREELGAEENSTAADFIREYATMNEDTEAFIKEYLISAIRNNLTSISVTINEYGQMEVTSEIIEDYINHDIKMEIDTTPFTAENGYKFELGKILYPNGTQFLPR
jgi:hypothetical protein